MSNYKSFHATRAIFVYKNLTLVEALYYIVHYAYDFIIFKFINFLFLVLLEILEISTILQSQCVKFVPLLREKTFWWS